MTLLRRLLILLTLVPQLLVLGLGGGVYLCLDPGGDAHLQISVDSCCGGGVSWSSPGDAVEMSAPGGADDCRSCRDVTIVADLGTTRTPVRVDPDSGTAPGFPAVAGVGLHGWPTLPRRAVIVARDREPRALLHLRSVVIRC